MTRSKAVSILAILGFSVAMSLPTRVDAKGGHLPKYHSVKMPKTLDGHPVKREAMSRNQPPEPKTATSPTKVSP